MIHKQARQFNRLRDAYELVLGQESLEGSRYTHVIRTRTDIVFAFPWHIGVDQLLAAVPDGKVAGPAWGCRERPPNTCLVFSDQFWISWRSRSWLTFVVHPFTFSNSPTVEEMVSALRCEEGVPPTQIPYPCLHQHLTIVTPEEERARHSICRSIMSNKQAHGPFTVPSSWSALKITICWIVAPSQVPGFCCGPARIISRWTSRPDTAYLNNNPSDIPLTPSSEHGLLRGAAGRKKACSTTFTTQKPS